MEFNNKDIIYIIKNSIKLCLYNSKEDDIETIINTTLITCFDTLKLSINDGYKWKSITTIAIIKFCIEDIQNWLIDNNYDYYNNDSTLTIIQNRCLEILKWSIENGCPWDEMTGFVLVKYGGIEMLKWALKNGCPWHSTIKYIIISFSHLDIIKWSTENKYISLHDLDNYNLSSLCKNKNIDRHEFINWLAHLNYSLTNIKKIINNMDIDNFKYYLMLYKSCSNLISYKNKYADKLKDNGEFIKSMIIYSDLATNGLIDASNKMLDTEFLINFSTSLLKNKIDICT